MMKHKKAKQLALIERHIQVLEEERRRRGDLEKRKNSRRCSLPSNLPKVNCKDNENSSMLRTTSSKFQNSRPPNCKQEARCSDAILDLYSNVRMSHSYYRLGLDAEGKIRKKKKKLCGLLPPCTCKKSSGVNPELFEEPAGPDAARRLSDRMKKRRDANVNMYDVRKDRFSACYAAIVQDARYKIFSTFISILALYTKDLCYATMPRTADVYVLDCVLSFAFFWLLTELILYSITHRNYCFTFFFWLDFIGTASIAMDIPWILLGFGASGNLFLIVKGGRMGRAARGAGSIRLIKLIKMVRMVKLFRIIQLFRKNKTIEEDDQEAQDAANQKGRRSLVNEEGESEVKPNRMGSLLADRITQKVILGVLMSILVMPLFDVGSVDSGEKTFIALENLEYLYSNHHDAAGDLLASHAMDYDNSLSKFNHYQQEEILYLKVGSADDPSIFREEVAMKPNDLRETEQAEFRSGTERTTAILNIRPMVLEEAILNIALTTFMMSIFALGAFVISIDAFMLVYPLEYLVIVLQRLANVAVSVMDEEGIKNDQAIQENELVGCVMQAMTDIFYSGKSETMFFEALIQDGSDKDFAKGAAQMSRVSKVLDGALLMEENDNSISNSSIVPGTGKAVIEMGASNVDTEEERVPINMPHAAQCKRSATEHFT